MAHPVIGARVRVDDERVGLGSLQQPLVLLRERVRHRGKCEGVALGGPLVLFVLPRVAPHLREALVVQETAATGMRVHAVQQLAALTVLVPALVDVLADDAAAQRHAKAVSLLDVTGQRIRIAR